MTSSRATTSMRPLPQEVADGASAGARRPQAPVAPVAPGALEAALQQPPGDQVDGEHVQPPRAQEAAVGGPIGWPPGASPKPCQRLQPPEKYFCSSSPRWPSRANTSSRPGAQLTAAGSAISRVRIGVRSPVR